MMPSKEMIATMEAATGNFLPYPLAEKIIAEASKGGPQARENIMLMLVKFGADAVKKSDELRAQIKSQIK